MTSLEIRAVQFRNRLNRIFPSFKKDRFVSVIITAAGSGTRLGGVSKPFFSLCGKPCLYYSLIAFEKCDKVREIIVTARAEEVDRIYQLCHQYRISKLSAVVLGGATRQESVENGFLKVHPKADFVAIHDAARPLITTKQIETLLTQAFRFGASTAAKKMIETVKKSDQKGMILQTVPREDLYTVQTPQIFMCDLYRASLALAKRDKISVTDDCSLAEHAGFPVKLVELGSCNLKLTTLDDIQFINRILEEKNDG